MLKDIVKSHGRLAALIASLSMAACSSAGTGAPPLAPAAHAESSRPAEQADAVVLAASSSSCVTGIPCSMTQVIAPLRGTYNAMGIFYFTNSTTASPLATTTRPYIVVKMPLTVAQPCDSSCGIAVSGKPLTVGNSYNASIIEGPLTEVKDEITVQAQSLKMPAGTYYFYLVQQV
jgi:hypothetical protein